MTRLPDWEQRLLDYLGEVFDTPYAYGRHDCLIHCGRVVEAVTGADHYSAFIGRYRTESGAARVMRHLGGRNPEEVLDKLFPERSLAFAQRGDLVLTPDGIPGVAMGDHALIVGSNGEREGLVRVPRAAWTKAWAL